MTYQDKMVCFLAFLDQLKSRRSFIVCSLHLQSARQI